MVDYLIMAIDLTLTTHAMYITFVLHTGDLNISNNVFIFNKYDHNGATTCDL